MMASGREMMASDHGVHRQGDDGIGQGDDGISSRGAQAGR